MYIVRAGALPYVGMLHKTISNSAREFISIIKVKHVHP